MLKAIRLAVLAIMANYYGSNAQYPIKAELLLRLNNRLGLALCIGLVES